MNKIDFAIVFSVTQANPNGDPLNDNAPRVDLDGYGYVTEECIKRKLRNRLAEKGQNIFVRGPEADGCTHLQARYKTIAGEVKEADDKTFHDVVCKKWYDVRMFGQVFPFKGEDGGDSKSVRGAFTVRRAFSVDPVYITSIQITKSVNGTEPKKVGGKSSDTMGMVHTVDFGVYVAYGSINSMLAEKNGLTQDDYDELKEAILTLFHNDCSAARPEGSMVVERVVWWEHNCPAGQYATHKVHNSLELRKKSERVRKFSDYEFSVKELPGLSVEIIEP